MHPLVFMAICLGVLGAASYGIRLLPLHPQPKQVAHVGLVVIFLAYVSRHFGLL